MIKPLCKNRGENLYINAVCVDKTENEHVFKHLSKKTSSDATNGYRWLCIIQNFAEVQNIQIQQILSQRHAKGALNLGAINPPHSRLSAFWPENAERDPYTKYLDLQLMLFWQLEKRKICLSIRKLS